MKKILLFIGLVVTNLLANAQQANVVIDPSFNTGSGFNGGVSVVVRQPDGKIIVGGSFTSYNGNLGINRLARLNTDGSLDTEFASNIGYGFNDSVTTIALQQDGGLLVGGLFTEVNTYSHKRMTRLDSTGTVDWYLCQNMGIGFGNDVYKIILQPDGKILVGGKFGSYHVTNRYNIIRLNSDLTIDPYFSLLGFKTTAPLGSYIRDIAISDDGDKIYVGGEFTQIRISPTINFDIYHNYAILNFNGDQLPSLNCDLNGRVNVVKPRIGGDFWSCSGIPVSRIYDVPCALNYEVTSMTKQSDGKLIVGTNYGAKGLYRINSDFSAVDNSFSIGTGFEGPFSSIKSIILQPDGKIVVGGGFSSFNGATVNGLVRLIEGPSNNPNNYLATYPFNNNTNDESGNGYHATNNGAFLTADRLGNTNKAYDFNGTSNYIQFPSAIGTGVTTVSMWFKPTSSQDNQMILRNRMYGYEIAYNKVYDGTDRANKLSTKLYINNSSGGYNEYTYIHPSNLNLNQWYHIAFTYDGNYYRVYLDNVMVYQSNSFGTGTVKYENSGAGYVIGRDGDTPYWYFKGSIDDLSVWGQALSGSELNTIYTGGTLNSTDFENSKSLILYPNPAKDILYIKNPENISITNCELYDISGKMIKAQIINNSIEVSQLQKGIYLIKLETSDGIFTKKFIKE